MEESKVTKMEENVERAEENTGSIAVEQIHETVEVAPAGLKDLDTDQVVDLILQLSYNNDQILAHLHDRKRRDLREAPNHVLIKKLGNNVQTLSTALKELRLRAVDFAELKDSGKWQELKERYYPA